MEVGKKKQRCYKERNENKAFSRRRKRGKRDENGGKEGWFARKKFESQLWELIFFFLPPVRSLMHENKKKIYKKEKKRKEGWKIKHGRMCDVATVQNHYSHFLLPVPPEYRRLPGLLGLFSWLQKFSLRWWIIVRWKLDRWPYHSLTYFFLLFSIDWMIHWHGKLSSNSTQKNFKLTEDDYIRCNCSSFL